MGTFRDNTICAIISTSDRLSAFSLPVTPIWPVNLYKYLTVISDNYKSQGITFLPYRQYDVKECIEFTVDIYVRTISIIISKELFL